MSTLTPSRPERNFAPHSSPPPEAHVQAQHAASVLGVHEQLISVPGGGRRWTFRNSALIVHVAMPGWEGLLEKETVVLSALDGRHSPSVLASGSDQMTWQVQERLPGAALHIVWHSLSTAERRSAIEQAADVLRYVHDATSPLSSPSSSLRPAGPEGIRSLLGEAHSKGLVPEELRRLTLSWLVERPHLDDPVGKDEMVLCHGDFGPRNLIWHEGKVSMIDLELSTNEHPTTELLALLPQLRGLADVGDVSAEDLMRSCYPRPWEDQHREDRLVMLRVMRRLTLLLEESLRPRELQRLEVHQSEALNLLLTDGRSLGSLPEPALSAR